MGFFFAPPFAAGGKNGSVFAVRRHSFFPPGHFAVVTFCLFSVFSDENVFLGPFRHRLRSTFWLGFAFRLGAFFNVLVWVLIVTSFAQEYF